MFLPYDRIMKILPLVVLFYLLFFVTTVHAVSFERDLTIGSKGTDVKNLQQILFQKGRLRIEPTGYFGGATQTALAEWQKEAGLVPARGYFGPKSRARLSAAFTSPHATIEQQTSSTIVTSTLPSLSVSLSPESPAAGVLVSDSDAAASRVPVIGINLSAGLGSDVNISGIKFHKTGFLSDGAIAGAYIIQNNRVIAPYTSISQGTIRFVGLNLNIPAGQTQTIWLAIDPATQLNPGNRVAFSFLSSADVVAANASGTAVVANGLFPITGETFTVTSVSNPSLASLAVTALPIGTSITLPAVNHLVASWRFDVANDRILLKNLRLNQAGVAAPDAIKNVELFINGIQVGGVIPQPGDDGFVSWDMSKNPPILPAGSSNVEVYADIVGSPGYDVQFQIFNPYDILAVDSEYGVPIHGQADPGTDIGIQAATLIITAHH
jgi:hypothetical protein